MASLEEKLLDGPSVGYCSSSEGEEEEAPECAAMPGNSSKNIPKGKETSRTGPKGVLADWERHQKRQRHRRGQEEKELLEQANKFSLETPLNKQTEAGAGQEEGEELERIRQRRLEQLKSMAKGRILEVRDRFEFLNLIEQSTRDCLLFVHIYADGSENEQSLRLNEVLLELAGRFGVASRKGGGGGVASPRAKFYKVQTKVLGTSNKFTRNALPTLQVYQAEQLVGNFVRINSELGEDYNGQALLDFLQRNGIRLDSRAD